MATTRKPFIQKGDGIVIVILGILIVLIGGVFNAGGWFEASAALFLMDIALSLHKIKDKINVTK